MGAYHRSVATAVGPARPARLGLKRGAVTVGVATLIVALAWGIAFSEWVPNTTNRYDMAEPFVHPWKALTWITQVILWLATLAAGRVWLFLVPIGMAAVAWQTVASVDSVRIGISDGVVTPLGALIGVLSISQIGLTLSWIVLIAVSKRMQP